MQTIDLNLIRAFVAVHEAGSFSGAAARLGVPRSTVSRAVASLEGSLGVRLFHRTTRKVSTSTAGLELYERSAAPLGALEASLADLPEREEVPSGTLRVTTIADLGAAVVAEAVARFTARYPSVQVAVYLGSEMVDLVRGGFDLAMRACEQGIRMRYARCVDLLDDLHAGLTDGTYARRLRGWAPPELLIIDDVGLGQIKKRGDEPTAAHTLDNLVDRRHGHVSTAVTTNISLSEWGRYLGDATLTAAILDRLVMHAIRIDIDGPSYRQHVANERAAGRKPTPTERPPARGA